MHCHSISVNNSFHTYLIIFLGDESCEKKLDSYFISHGISCKTFECKKEVKEFLEVDIPIISYDNEALLEIDSRCSAMNFHEWLGSIVCGVDW